MSVRTLYRDIQTLIGLGAPIDGEAGVGYMLKPGFFLPPLMFSAVEVEALGLGAEAAHVLRRLGLRRCGQLMSGPRAPLAKRLGEEVLERLDQVLGHRATALDLKLEIPPYLAEKRLASQGAVGRPAFR